MHQFLIVTKLSNLSIGWFPRNFGSKMRSLFVNENRRSHHLPSKWNMIPTITNAFPRSPFNMWKYLKDAVIRSKQILLEKHLKKFQWGFSDGHRLYEDRSVRFFFTRKCDISLLTVKKEKNKKTCTFF